jgi:acyl dehydratase
MATHFFEDYRAGDVYELGERGVSEAEIVEFGRRYDPQYFHTDPEAAKRSIWGGLAASGWLTTALFMRLFVDGHLKDVDSIASPGVDEIRWLKPVRPGDTLRGRLTVLETTPSKSGAARGLIRTLGELFNQRGELVLTIRAMNLIGTRPAQGTPCSTG